MTALAGILVDVQRLSTTRCTTPIQGKLAYATTENFLGRIVDGYHADAADVLLLTPTAAGALCEAHNALRSIGLGLYIFDSYRPQRAVKDFSHWFAAPVDAAEQKRQAQYYPNFKKQELGALGYIADPISRHNFGHTVDLTLQNLKTGELLDLGAPFDFFDPISHITAKVPQISKEAHYHRLLLAGAMQAAGFMPFEQEYWHFEHQTQTVAQPLDIPITADLKGL